MASAMSPSNSSMPGGPSVPPRSTTPVSAGGGQQATQSHAPAQGAPTQAQNFPPLASTISKTTGQEPTPLVGPSTTIVGDTLYVFGGRILSRTRPQLTSDMYALDLVTRVWSKLDTRGAIPPPRYFHSVCALGDTKLVCFGGMSPVGLNSTSAPAMPLSNISPTATSAPGSIDNQNDMQVMSDIHIYDIASQTWTFIPTMNSPEGRYAHCATVIPSTAVYTSSNPNQPGEDGDEHGGAELVIVGGQDSANHYIEEINVFNLRTCQWTSVSNLDRSCGAYRSVVAPLGRALTAKQVGAGVEGSDTPSPPPPPPGPTSDDAQIKTEDHGAMLIYSNYNFLDVKLELQVRLPDGSLSERPMAGQFSPPGLRFPNGGVLDNHFVVSGTFLTSSRQEYALWALDLRTLEWSRIDAGAVFSTGSWNRGVLWSRRNTFLVLGNRTRSLVEDYNHRRINFSHVCMVELEAFGLYENPRQCSHPALQKCFSPNAQDLGLSFMTMKEMADMEFLAIGGERIPVNSRTIAKRWGPHFVELLNASNPAPAPQTSHSNRAVSMATITPLTFSSANIPLLPPTTAQFNPVERPRTLFLPHTQPTIDTLVKFLYTGTLPPAHSADCSPQILCSLLQLARPYRIDGLLEEVVERLHQVLDRNNAAAVFNAAAMAAGGGAGILVTNDIDEDPVIRDDQWRGAVSSVIGLQKRGLRGLMEGRRLRERGRSVGTGGSVSMAPGMQGTFGTGA